MLRRPIALHLIHNLTHLPKIAAPQAREMSWMDSWSRPSKSQATPAPFYLLPNGDATPYCRTCGRVIPGRKSAAASKPSPSSSSSPPATPEPKYCSARCRGQKPGRLDREIEHAFVRFLTGAESIEGAKRVKGDARVLVPCDIVEARIFGPRKDPEKVFGRRKNRASRVIPETDDGADSAVDLGEAPHDGDPGEAIIDEMLGRAKPADRDPGAQAIPSVRSGAHVRPPQNRSQVNGSVGGEKGRAERTGETEEMREKRTEGQRRAHEREMVRCAARRGVVFGFAVEGDERRRCEAVMGGRVVEPSFAKGDWAVRWRED